jgi:hypothetical protein
MPFLPAACMTWGVPAIAVSLGASYFQRLLLKNPQMCLKARQQGWFRELGGTVSSWLCLCPLWVISGLHVGWSRCSMTASYMHRPALASGHCYSA